MKKNSHRKNKTFHAHKPSGHQKEARYSMTKRLIIAIIAVFSLIIIFGLYIFVFNSGQPGQSEAVNSLVATCGSWCETEMVNEWCDFELSAGGDLARGSCYGFANSPLYTELGVNKCPAIDCNNRPVIDETCMVGLGGVWENPTTEGQCEQIGDSQRFLLVPTDSPPVAGQVCCSPIETFE